MNKVIVCGSINMDIVARVSHHPLPGETIAGSDQNYYPGGKGANQAVASARAGVETVMIGAVGKDPFGETLIEFLKSCDINTTNIEVSGDDPSGTALIAVDDNGQNTIIINAGANDSLDDSVKTIVEIKTGDVVVAQFETPKTATLSIFEKAKSNGAITILNPAPASEISKELLEVTDYLALNEIELAMISGSMISNEASEDEINIAIKNLKSSGYEGNIILTLGSKGVVAYIGDETIQVEGEKVKSIDTTGAGDCFVGNFAAMIASGKSIQNSLKYANTAASISVQRAGAGPSMPSYHEVNINI